MSTSNQGTLRLNRHLFTETGTDSGALNVLGTVVHQFPDEGDYVVEVSREGEPVGRRLLVVSDDYHSVQADFDLSAFGPTTVDDGCDCGGTGGANCDCEGESYTCIREGGFGVFYVGRGPGGYTVVVDPVGERREAREFDSTEIAEDDTFAAVLVRPGKYVVRNLATDDEGSVTVTYPDPDREREAVRESVAVECTDEGFDPAEAELHPGQGLVFTVETPARIRIELVEPHERATDDARPVRVSNPRRPGLAARGRTRQSRVDPSDLSTADLKTRLESVTSPLELRAVLAAERRGRNRQGAKRAIERRLAELGGEREE